MTKPTFIWCNGTSFVFNIFDQGWLPTTTDASARTVYGTNGRSVAWNGLPQNDPFPSLVDPNAWDVVKIPYPASFFPAFGPTGSVTSGINKTLAVINSLPQGTPFALGGYSQGAVVMSQVLKTLQSGSSRYGDLKAAVMFGNPCRATDKLWPAHSGLAGGLFSGAWDIPGSTTGGGGCFPSTYRLSSAPSYWWEFVGGRNQQYDPVTSNSTTGQGAAFIALNAEILSTGPGVLLQLFPFHLDWLAAFLVVKDLGAGHGAYPSNPPPGYGPSDPTSYQIALGYLDSVARDLSTAPSLLPTSLTPTTPGWSTTLSPPAA